MLIETLQHRLHPTTSAEAPGGVSGFATAVLL